MGELQSLIEISRFYGDNPAYVIAGGGNTSYKDSEKIWIKASGIPLAGIREEGFVSLSRKKLSLIETREYGKDPVQREIEVKKDMTGAILSPANLRPSVETSLHNLIEYSYVIHTHPTHVNALMCAREARREVKARFGEQALYVDYTDPGFILFKKLQERIGSYRIKHGKAPQIIFLQNHGVFVGADRVEEIKRLYDEIERGISTGPDDPLPSPETAEYVSEVTMAVGRYYGSRGLKSRSVSADLISHFSGSRAQFKRVSRPFTPDIIVYCKSSYLFLPKGTYGGGLLRELEEFESTFGHYPKVILEEMGGMVVVEESDHSLQHVMDLFLEQMKISFLSEYFGGPHYMTPAQVRFIDNWEAEHYRRKVAKGL